MRRLTLPAAIAVSLTAGCTAGPHYHEPHLSTPSRYGSQALISAANANAATGTLAVWWEQFHDAQLNILIERALQGNLDLETAASRVRVAREQVIVAGAAGRPQLNADADASALHLSQNSGFSQFANLLGGGGGSGGGAGGAQNGFALPGGNITTYTLGFDASWEIDLFGSVRRSVEAAAANAEQAVWNRRDSEISITAEVANDYCLLRSLQSQIAIANEEVARQGQLLSLLRARRRFGFVTDQDVRSQASQLATAKATLPDLESERDAQIHALGVLVGEQPEALEVELSVAKQLPPLPPAIPVGLPSDLLRRRPDVRAAERMLAASNAQIGVAIAALYPKINLTGALDLVSLDLKHLLDLASRQYTAAGALTWPLFAGGRGRANIRIAEEQNRQALYDYQNTVLGALQDVEDALTRYGDELQKNQALRDAASEALGAADVARSQYQAGVSNIGSVLTVQGAALQANLQLAQSDGALDRDLISLYKALGGGWREQ